MGLRSSVIVLIFILSSVLFMALSLPAQGQNASPIPVFTVSVDEVVQTLGPNFHGVNYVAYGDPLQGSAASRDALKRAGVRMIRFPGGEPGNFYDWTEPDADGWSTTDIDELWVYAKGVGARLMFQTNPTHQHGNDPSGEQVAALVKYCKENGIGVDLWEIGNEPDTIRPKTEEGSITFPQYKERFIEQAQAIHAADPQAKVLGPAAANAYYWEHENTLEKFLAECDPYVDAVSLHWYIATGSSSWMAIRDFASEWEARMKFIRTKTKKPLYVTEWSGAGASDTGDAAKRVGLALVNADVIGQFARSGVAGHCMFGGIHQVHKGWGLLAGAKDYREPEWAAPQYYLLPLWSLMGDQVLRAEVRSNPDSHLSIYAHKRTDQSVQVMFVNRASERTVEVRFNGPFDAAGQTVRIHELKPSKADPDNWDVIYNGVPAPQPAKAELPPPLTGSATGGSFQRTLPGYSITVLEFPAGCRIPPTPIPTPKKYRYGKTPAVK